jgi:hypothetical protein
MASNLIDKLPKHLQNLISEFNSDHRAALAPSLMCIEEHRNCVYCNVIVRGVKTIYPGVRFFCDSFCRDEWDYERELEEYAHRMVTPLVATWH